MPLSDPVSSRWEPLTELRSKDFRWLFLPSSREFVGCQLIERDKGGGLERRICWLVEILATGARMHVGDARIGSTLTPLEVLAQAAEKPAG